ncbi:hypothetical protein CTI12_AA510170 [Artemisia annua]|uniref:DUF8040 domain-containing protein n=1 Tax=Artemisia annua TaxID=35608 RepID=A0A2U1LBB2_ARTAN|nr:hypothetical protein CTI12_AA510170 [Artemisia annua]
MAATSVPAKRGVEVNGNEIEMVGMMRLDMGIFYHKLGWILVNRKRKRDNTSTMSGHQYTQELLQGNNLQCTELIRMSRDSFVRLCNHFKERNWLRDSKHISVEEKMFIFLMIVGHNERFSVMKRSLLERLHVYDCMTLCFGDAYHVFDEMPVKFFV